MGNRKDYVRERHVWINGTMVTLTDDDYRQQQNAMFMNIWREREHICVISKAPLSTEPFSYYFHHVLEKRNKQFERYALCKWNIVLLTREVHNMYEAKEDTQPLLVKLRRELIIQLEDPTCEFDNDVIFNPYSATADHLVSLFGNKIN